MLWVTFTSRFLLQYFSRTEREAIEREFLFIEQGDRNVYQYFDRFLRLSLHIEPYATDGERKALKFQQGLHPDILENMMGDRFDNLQGVKDKAEIIEQQLQLIKEKAEMFQPQPRGEGQGRKRKKNWKGGRNQ